MSPRVTWASGLGAKRLRAWALGLAFASALGFPADGAAQVRLPSLEYPVKATFLYKFGSFVEWPPAAFASPTAPFVVCIVGDDPFGPVLDRAAANERVGLHPVAVRRMAQVAAGPIPCHVLYTIGSKAQPAAEVLSAVRGAPILTVTDERRGDGARGIVHFVVRNNRVRFLIDGAASEENGLTISSKLMSLSVKAQEREDGP